jgi:hypothetical protein
LAEYFLGDELARHAISQELALYRRSPKHFVQQTHPGISFVTLDVLINDSAYQSSVDQSLFCAALACLKAPLQQWADASPLPPARVWVGLKAPQDAGWFGGFYHTGQGYRYLQQVAITSLSGIFSPLLVHRTLRTLELLRAYVHDTLHYASYRLFSPLPEGAACEQSFYRLQYGINFRRWSGQSYSVRDSVRSRTTRNLGNIMEAATDRFAHEFVRRQAEAIGYQPEPHHLLETYLYRDCTGQLTEQDMQHFRALERGQMESSLPSVFVMYLRYLRLFYQYVNLRYQRFLAECAGGEAEKLQTLILQGMITGKINALQHFLNTTQEKTKSFVAVFKSPDY